MLSKLQRNALIATGVGYAITSVAHAALQRRYARQNAAPMETEWKTSFPTLDIIIPVHNEVPSRLHETLLSIDGQYPADRLNVYLVDDCSKNREELQPIYDKYDARPNWHILLLQKNVGKRRAQDAAYQVSSGELYFTGDGDSPLAPNAILPMVVRMNDDRVGVVAGKVGVANQEENWLTRLLAERYRLMFELERAAQGRFGAVWTCTGPISLYRRELLDKLWSAYLNQTYKDKICLSGDDLQLTNLVIQAGYLAVYEDKAVANTYVPETLEEYWKQQTRWNRSMYRDQMLSIRSAMVRSRETGNVFPIVDTMVRTYFPLMLVVPPTMVVAHVLTRNRVRDDVIIMLAMLSVRGMITFWNADPKLVSKMRFTTNYGTIHFFALVPGRIRAIATRGNSNWGTRL